MADNVPIVENANSTPPDGTVVATDEVGDVHYQRIKLALGADGAVDMDLDSGQQTMANSAPVALASDQTAIPVDATGQGDVPISAAALPLPSGAATAANQQAAATAPTIFNVTMVNLDTEYSQALPANTRRFSLQCIDESDVRFAFEAGKVAGPAAPYALVRAGMNYFEEQLDLPAVTIYVASPDAGKIAEIIAWV